jgi:hypothetical protein
MFHLQQSAILEDRVNEKVTDTNELNATKRAWEAPTIEEIDYAATEAAYIFGGVSDLGIYTV